MQGHTFFFLFFLLQNIDGVVLTSIHSLCFEQNKKYNMSHPMGNQQSGYAKTKTQISFAVTAKLISPFVFDTRIVRFLFFLNSKFQASNSFLCLYRPVCVGPVRKPHCWFSHEAAHIYKKNFDLKFSIFTA